MKNAEGDGFTTAVKKKKIQNIQAVGGAWVDGESSGDVPAVFSHVPTLTFSQKCYQVKCPDQQLLILAFSHTAPSGLQCMSESIVSECR